MRKTSARVAILVASLFVFSAATARADDKADIKALYTKLSKAMIAKDTKAIMACGTKDFTMKQPGMPEMDAMASAKVMEEQFKPVKTIDQCVMAANKIDIKGKKATVASTFKVKLTMTGDDGKQHVMSDSGTGKDIVVKTDKGWLFKRSETLTMKPMMDGKPMSMNGAPPPTTKKPLKAAK